MATMSTDVYYRREVVTADLDWLGDELCRRTGRPRTAAGTKGDLNHKRGSHRSNEFCKRSPYSTSRTYTVQAGLTAEQERQIAGFDFTPGSTEAMIAQSRRLLAAMKAGHLEEVREIYCNVDGDKVVDGWDNVRNLAATSDSSHLWHWHLGLDRRHLTNRKLMARILAIALGDTIPKGDDMSWDEQLTNDDKKTATAGEILTDTADRAYKLVTYDVPKILSAIAAVGAAVGIDATELAAIQAAAKQGALDALRELPAAEIAEQLARVLPAGLAGQVADELHARLAS